jgi:Putative adhesin
MQWKQWSAGMILGAAVLSAPVAAYAADGTFDKTLHVSGAVILDISTGSGYIHVSPGSANEVHVIGHVHGSSWGWSSDRVSDVVNNPPIEQLGNIINIGKHQHLTNVSIDYDITVPKGTQLQAQTGSGDLHLLNLDGSVKAGTGSGDVEGSGLSGRVSLETGSGDIRADFRQATDVKAQTGSGSIRLHNVQGSLVAGTGSGDLEVGGTPSGGWKLETGSGSVILDTGSAHFTLDASTGSGNVHSDPPLTTHGSVEHHHVVGDVNGGGPTVRVETGSGDITIH